MKYKYIIHFKNNYHIPSPYNNKLMEIFNKRTSQSGIMNRSDEIFNYLHEFPKKDNTKQSKLF